MPLSSLAVYIICGYYFFTYYLKSLRVNRFSLMHCEQSEALGS